MDEDIRIKDLTNTALEMASDDYIGIDGLTNGSRKIPFSGIMDSLDSRLATANKTPRGAIAEIKQIVDSHGNVISSIKNMISDEYDDSADYDVGDYCIYDNVRYCCNTEISGGETWNSAHWDVAKVDDDITAINTKLSELSVDLTMSDDSTSHLNKFGRVVTIEYYNNTNTTKTDVTGQLPSGAFDGRVRQLKYTNIQIYINEQGAFAITANAWAHLTATFVLDS